jgi:hypothetical protein
MSGDHEELGEELERQAEQMRKASDTVGSHIRETRDDLHRKQNDPGVPGADPDDHFLAGGGRDVGRQAEQGDAEDPDAGGSGG